MNWVNTLKEALPEYAKDTRLNLDAVINRSGLDEVDAPPLPVPKLDGVDVNPLYVSKSPLLPIINVALLIPIPEPPKVVVVI